MKITDELLNFARDIYEKDIEEQKQVSTKDKIRHNVIEWTTFYRRNIDLFATDYLGIRPLAYLQRQCLISLSNSGTVYLICSRGMSKTFTTALYCICLLLLYPSIKIVATASTQSQAEAIVKKIEEIFCNETKRWGSPILNQMVRDGKIMFKTDNGITYIQMSDDLGGGYLKPLACIESSRGGRANVIITDECALIRKKNYDGIMRPMLEARAYKGRPKGLIERNELQELFLTSARDQLNWVFNALKKAVRNHYKNGSYDFFVGDIYTAVANGINTKEKLKRAKENSDEFTWLSEYLNIWLGNGALSLFKYEQFKKLQLLKDSFIERTIDDYLDGIKVNPSVKLNEDEIRILSVDVAVAIGQENDNTAILCGRYNIKSGLLYIDYVKTLNGQNTVKQACSIKRLFYDYQANYVIIDTMGVGAPLYDLLTKETEDDEIGNIYNAWTVNRENDLRIVSDKVYADKIQRTISNNAEEVIIAVTGNEQLNSDCHLSVRDALKNETVFYLQNDDDKITDMENDKNTKWLLKTAEEKARLILPFLTTRFMINETVALQCEKRGNKIHVRERGTDTKDLYMSMAYLIYFVFQKLRIRYAKNDINNNADENEISEEYLDLWGMVNV